ncbi:MAG: hypothetical protein PHW39_02910 [Syntrophomonadaceae bacterium]|jgi:hypothetical protein|nr:hypothetical protein [Clostridia bacterium]MDD4562012.1 hypothetical protein [Syntrophomonadaceae bacterium]
MPNFRLPDINNITTLDEVIEVLAIMRKEINYVLYNADDVNVTDLKTEYCSIHSAAGETIIDGPTLRMYDKQATPIQRIILGYDPATSGFVFDMYNAAGKQTLNLDAAGDYVFCGGTIRTDIVGADRIELSGGKFRGITAEGNITGLNFDIGAYPGTGIADVSFYHNNAELLILYDDILNYVIKPGSGTSWMVIGASGKTTYFHGSVSGLRTESDRTGEGGSDGHTHSIPHLTVEVE